MLALVVVLFCCCRACFAWNIIIIIACEMRLSVGFVQLLSSQHKIREFDDHLNFSDDDGYTHATICDTSIDSTTLWILFSDLGDQWSVPTRTRAPTVALIERLLDMRSEFLSTARPNPNY
jgi:hypothetical protein